MTFDEAIEKMAEALWDKYRPTTGGSEFCPWIKAPTHYRQLHIDDARAAAEAIGLREMMEALAEIRDADPVDMALDPQWPSRIAARALSPAP